MCRVAAADWFLSFYSVPGLLPRGSSPRHVKLPTTVTDTRVPDFSTGRDIPVENIYPPEIPVDSLEQSLTYFLQISFKSKSFESF